MLERADDAELLARSGADAQAFAVFYRRHERLIAGWLIRRTRDAEVTADLTAEVFAAAYLAAPRFRAGPEPAAAWLLGIARNKLMAARRRDRTAQEGRARLGVERGTLSDETVARINELADGDALDLLDGLPADQRAAVRAYVIDDVGYEELARSTEVSQAVARKRVSRGLAALRRAMSQEGSER
jgi:RNA polymerase sigma factor (sigma-70 family)